MMLFHLELKDPVILLMDELDEFSYIQSRRGIGGFGVLKVTNATLAGKHVDKSTPELQMDKDPDRRGFFLPRSL